MSIENSIQGVTTFLKKSQDLVEQVRNTTVATDEQLKILAGKLDTNQGQAGELAAALGNQFQVSKSQTTKDQQQSLLQQIAQISLRIDMFRNAPEIVADLLADRGTLYVALADTYDDTIGQFVVFTPEEIVAINTLLKQAALDAASRQRLADILNSAVQLTELALKVAVKVAAA